MTDQLSGSEAAKAIGDPFGTLAGLLAGFVPEGPARTAVLVVEGLCAAVAPFIYRYYLGVLAQGAAPEGSLERTSCGRASPGAISRRGFMRNGWGGFSITSINSSKAKNRGRSGRCFRAPLG